VINFDISDDKVIERLSGRLTCSKCQAIYNQKTNPPTVPDVCDLCGEEVVQRKDDTLETIKNRLQVYKKETEPLINYYQKKGVLKTVNADQKRETIESEVKSIFDNAFAPAH
jgi:adenylate kinase